MNQIDSDWALIEALLPEKNVPDSCCQEPKFLQKAMETGASGKSNICIQLISHLVFVTIVRKLLQILTPESLIMSMTRR